MSVFVKFTWSHGTIFEHAWCLSGLTVCGDAFAASDLIISLFLGLADAVPNCYISVCGAQHEIAEQTVLPAVM